MLARGVDSHSLYHGHANVHENPIYSISQKKEKCAIIVRAYCSPTRGIFKKCLGIQDFVVT
jgi:hypothetical protein